MSTPIETAAEALLMSWRIDYEGITDEARGDARTVLASLARHRDDIARVLTSHEATTGSRRVFCSCGRWPHDERDDETFDGHARHQADAVLAYLTGAQR